ncbi:MAG: dienelactone hydrolase family protein [Bacteroidetes bacterium]|nr:dienelactone hydrolase family protein [Bacteroidota bacterium]
MTIKKILISLLVICLTNSLFGQTLVDNYYYYKPNSTNSTNKWIILLPGSSGLTIFNDKTFFNRQADTLSNWGYSVILIDYKSFYKSSRDKTKPNSSTGDKIAWVVKQVVSLAAKRQQINLNESGHILGWSLAGEGVFNLLRDTTYIQENNIKSVALYYPSNQEDQKITTSIPLLIQFGEKDNVVNFQKISTQITDRTKTQIIIYPNSSHGFDIETLTTERKLRFPPLVGKKYVFKYNKLAAEQAQKELKSFLRK